MPSGPYDMRQYVEFAHAIGVTMQNNCPTAEWHSWKYVSENVKNELMKLMEEALKGGYKWWHYDMERNEGPSKQ
ncbi:hypothetical protein C1H46_000322 [Malus baccata]|uniref:Uncharacterized protein n=1 Tax=Malus baccata TaxID=106549 RepID=A0A540NSK8_MALBA|nr:hypothetical protein C1H46_000322 [Malus baccata]